jgi:hypothetical protein
MRTIYLLTLAMLSAASPASAHAMLERASPLVGSEVPTPPHEITLTFTEGNRCSARSSYATRVAPSSRRPSRGRNRGTIAGLSSNWPERTKCSVLTGKDFGKVAENLSTRVSV